MIKFFQKVGFLVLLLGSGEALAQVPISNLPSAGTISQSNYLPLVQGTDSGPLVTTKISVSALSTYLFTNPSIVGTDPSFDLLDTSTSNNTARWQFINYQGTFQLNAVNDANTANSQAFTCSRNGYTVSGCAFAVPLTTSAGTFSGPASGGVLGLWPNLYFAPNPNFSGILTVAGATLPTINLKSTSVSTAGAIYQGTDGALNIQPNNSGSNTNIFQAGGALYVHDSVGSAQINMLAAGQSSPVTLWEDTQSNAWLSPSATNADTTIVAKGNGTLYFNANSIQFNNPFTTDTSKCGSLSGATGCLQVKNDGGTVGYVPWFQGP